MATTRVATGIDIEYEVHGSGEPLLLVMGLGGQLVSWPDAFVEGFVDRGYQVVLFDNRDIGLSTKIDAPMPSMGRTVAGSLSRRFARSEYLLSDMAADTAGLLDVLDIGSAHVVGISMGGMIAQQLAIDHGRRVRSLTSIMSTTGSRRVGQPKLRVLAQLAKLARGPLDTFVDREVEIARVISGSSHDDREARVIADRMMRRSYAPDGTARQTAAIMASPDRTAALGSVTAPTLVIHGLEDVLVTPSGGLATTRAVPGARLLVFPDMGHNLPAGRIGDIHDAVVDTTRRATPVDA